MMQRIAMWCAVLLGSGVMAIAGAFLWACAIEKFITYCKIKHALVAFIWNRAERNEAKRRAEKYQ